MSAALTIFCNILLAPLSPGTSADLQLLWKSADLIRKLRVGHSPLSQRTHLMHLEDLIVELGEVSEIAIAEA